jgi:hypothetical protein
MLLRCQKWRNHRVTPFGNPHAVAPKRPQLSGQAVSMAFVKAGLAQSVHAGLEMFLRSEASRTARQFPDYPPALALSHQPFLLVSTYPVEEAGFDKINGLVNRSRTARESLLARCDNALQGNVVRSLIRPPRRWILPNRPMSARAGRRKPATQGETPDQVARINDDDPARSRALRFHLLSGPFRGGD